MEIVVYGIITIAAIFYFREATSQADMLAYPFGDCREGKISFVYAEGYLPENKRAFVVLYRTFVFCGND